jgi:hypothetical protein
MPLLSVVKPQYGPTLPQLVRRLPPVGRAAFVAGVALLIALAIVIALRSRPRETNVIVRGATTFNLTYGPQLQRVPAPGALFALRRERNGLFLDSYVVRPLVLPPYRGAAGGTLPVYSVAILRRLRKRYGDVDVVLDGRTRINNAIGYQLVLRGKLGTRTLYVRYLMLVPEAPEGARRGVIVELESTPAAGTPNAVGIGNAGPLKQAMRSFRFGTSREGGTQ